MDLNKRKNIFLLIFALLPNKKYSIYKNIARIIGLIIVLGIIFIIIYDTYIHHKFNLRNIENADIIIECKEKFSEEEIQEFIKIAKADFIKYDAILKAYGTKQDKVYVLNSLNFIDGNELIKTKDVIVFCAQYDFYQEPFYYLIGKKKSYKEYWYFIRDSETNQYYLETKSGTFSPDNIYRIPTGKGNFKYKIRLF